MDKIKLVLLPKYHTVYHFCFRIEWHFNIDKKRTLCEDGDYFNFRVKREFSYIHTFADRMRKSFGESL